MGINILYSGEYNRGNNGDMNNNKKKKRRERDGLGEDSRDGIKNVYRNVRYEDNNGRDENNRRDGDVGMGDGVKGVNNIGRVINVVNV